MTIKHAISILTIATICKLFYFYLFFDLNIFLFLQTDEILMHIVYSTPLIFFFFLITLTMFHFIKEENYIKKKFPKISKSESQVLYVVFVLLLLCIIALFRILFQSSKINEYILVQEIILYNLLFYSSILTLTICFIFFRIKNRESNFIKSYCNENSSKFFSLTICIIMLVCSFNVTEIIRAKNNKLHENLEFELSDNMVIRSSKNLFCIGITRNFIIMYDEIEKIPTIYNLSEVKLIKTKYSLNSKIK